MIFYLWIVSFVSNDWSYIVSSFFYVSLKKLIVSGFIIKFIACPGLTSVQESCPLNFVSSSLFSNSSNPASAAHILLDVSPCTDVWLTYHRPHP